jgi:conjugal transfer pilus assembly protein TraD
MTRTAPTQAGRARAGGKQGAVLGTLLAGERALPVVNRFVLLSKERLCRHVLVCGATGSGKTETVLRLAWTVAKGTRAPVFYLDGKGDRQTAERFVGLMTDAGRQTRVFPNEPLDGWRGEPHELKGRLMQLVDFAREGAAAWYTDVAKVVLGLACEHPKGPPRCSRELLARMDLEALKRAHGEIQALTALTSQQVSQVSLRYEAFFGQTRGALDGGALDGTLGERTPDEAGGWAWEETKAAYLLLDSLALHEETACLARFLLEDFAHYFTTRKPAGEWALLVVDEFSAVAGAGSMARCVEQARGFDTALVLAPQVVAGMGGRVEGERILGSVETVVCHRVNTPEEIVALAGTKPMPHYSARLTRGRATGEGSMQQRDRYKVDPNKVRSLPAGEAYVISRGRAMKAQILRAPQLKSSLPEPKAAAAPSGTPASVPPGGRRSDKEKEDGTEEMPF